MTRKEIEIELRKGRTLDSILHFVRGQECMIFKADKFQLGDEVLYIPDIDLNEIPTDEDLSRNEEEIKGVLEHCYTGNDFVDLCRGKIKHAQELFDYCDWQGPSSALDEIIFNEPEWFGEAGALFVGDDLFIVTENETGELYVIRFKYVQDLIDDWNGVCNFCPSNDARVFFACWNETPFNPYMYTDFQSLMENVLIPKFGR